MRVAKTLAEFRELRAELPSPVGFVPTMGYLHDGHLSLARMARADCASVVASIFVNPTQFAPNEDLDAYPRDLARDLELLEGIGTDLVLAPDDNTEIYPEHDSTWVTVENLTQRLEGGSRPTHFRGVATVVTKLFNIVQPDRAYFGQKDAQQALVIRRMVRDLMMPIQLILGPTIREPDGLAMSSRNAYLEPDQRAAAVILRKALDLAEHLYNEGERDATTIRQAMMALLDAEPLAQPDYVSIASIDTLEELERIEAQALVSLAVKIGLPRLIDNTVLPPGVGLW